MTEMLPSEKVAPDRRHDGHLSGGAAMEIAFFDYFEENPARTRIYPFHSQATENTYRINCTSARKTGIVMPVRVGLICRIVTNLLDLGSSSRAERWRNGTAEAARNSTESRDATGSSRTSRWRRRQGHGTSITRSA